MTMGDRQPTVSVPIGLTKGWHRDSAWTATYGPLSGQGATQAAAKADLTTALAAALSAGDADPAFARDDDGAVIVAIPDLHGGVTVWRVGETARMICRQDGPPETVAEHCHHYTPIPRRR